MGDGARSLSPANRGSRGRGIAGLLAVGSIEHPGAPGHEPCLYLRYAPGIPQISVSAKSFPEAHDKVVFIGVTAQTAARDRLMTPSGT